MRLFFTQILKVLMVGHLLRFCFKPLGLFLFVALFHEQSHAQDTLVLRAEDRLLGPQQTSGFSMEVPRLYRVVRRSCWRFLKTLAAVRLHKDHWQLHFKEGLVLYVAVKAAKTESSSYIYMGLTAALPREQAARYAPELRALLQAFYVTDARNSLQARLLNHERQREQKSTRYEAIRHKEQKLKASGRSLSAALLKELTHLAAEIEALQEQEATLIGRLSTLGDNKTNTTDNADASAVDKKP